MKVYEVAYTEQIGRRIRVVHKEFNDFDVALEYASVICLDNDNIIACSIYRGTILVMDVQ